MEDRYLFKAKFDDSDRWVEGWLVETNDKYFIIPTYASKISAFWFSASNIIEVKKETICQCTGLKDKNGKLIWENDIVNAISSNSVGDPICVDGIVVNVTDYNLMLNLNYANELECVGNKFDNAELLESEGEYDRE